MPDHDELCPQRHQYRGHKSRCVCALLAAARAEEQERNAYAGPCWDGCLNNDAHLAALDARDRELAHAEAVAAKLVEVICERDERVGYWHRRWDFAQGQMDAMGASLLAARAEVERLRSPEWEAEVRADERERIVAELEGPARESEAMYVHAEQVAARLVEVICDDEHWRREDSFREIKRLIAQRDAARAEVASLREQWKGSWAANIRREVLADLREQVLMLEHEDECVTRWQPRDLRRKKRPCDCLIADVITKIEEAGR